MDRFKHVKWISNGNKTPFYARKIFCVEKKIKGAIVHGCGLGQFQLFINGRKVGESVLEPAWTDYNKRLNYVTYDITSLINEGENIVSSEVGNGWFIMDDAGGYVFHFPPFMPPNPNGYKPYADVLMLMISLEITYLDDSVEYICTDESWKVREHMISHSNVFGSEIVDGRKRVENWKELVCDEDSWGNAYIVNSTELPKGELTPQLIPSSKILHRYRGKYLYKIGNRYIYDFSKNVAGMLAFDVKGKRGDIVRVFPAEKLDRNGDVDQMAKNWLPIDVCETYIIGEDDVWEHFEMIFTYIGARYLAVEGITAESIANIELKAISSAYENTGEFFCDDVRFMQIYEMIQTTIESNMLSVHTDCPTIERFAWQEENHLMAPSIMYLKQVKKHWEKFLEDARVSQHEAEDSFYDMSGGQFFPGEGLIPSMAPCYIPNVLPVPGLGSFYDTIGWGSSIILGAYWHYCFYGDEEVVRRNYVAGKRYLKHLKSCLTEEGFINHGLGDWGNPKGEFARENVETALYYADLKTMIEFAKLLGEVEDAECFTKEAEAIKQNYNEKLLCINGTTGKHTYRVWGHDKTLVQTQASLAMPLYWGMVPEEVIMDIVWSLEKLLKEEKAIVSGEVGHPYIIQTMSKYGMHDLICQYILKEEHPSYFAFVKAGETSLGEYWEENPRSHCHDMMGHIMEWFYNGIAGIHALKPGFAEVLIKPFLPDSMNEVKCSYFSINGEIVVSMKRLADEIVLDVAVADGIKVTVDKQFLKKRER